jgi:thioesterase domain-containing protein
MQLADYYVGIIIANQPKGPYRLGGWSAGGLIAQHMAQILADKGRQVDYFIGFDCFMSMPYKQQRDEFKLLKKIVAFIRGEEQLSTGFYHKGIENKSISDILAITAKILMVDDDSGMSVSQMIMSLRFGINYLRAKVSLRHQLITGKSVLFIAEQNTDKELIRSGWNKAIKSSDMTDFVTIEGGHLDIFQGISFKTIVDKIKSDISTDIKIERKINEIQ